MNFVMEEINSARLEVLLSSVSIKYHMSLKLKSQQQEVVLNLLNNNNTMAILPTGFGKSLTFILLPLLLDEMFPEKGPHIGLIITPLRSLIFDQVQRCKSMGIKSVAITKMEEMSQEDIEAVRTGTASLVFASPEALECGPWVSYMQKYHRRVSLLAFDEIHCLSEWGSDFRPDYLKMALLRSKFTSAPILGLSATVTSEVLGEIKSALHLEDHEMKIVSMLPDRPNIFLEVKHQIRYDYEHDLDWIVEELRGQRQSYPKTIIFCSSVNTVADIFIHLMNALGTDAYAGERALETRLVSMYHGEIGKALQDYTLETFPRADTCLRVLVSTIAFGMGVEVQDIRQIVHWGKSKSMMCYWQEVGRAGRDGKSAKAIWYPKTISPKDKHVFSLLRQNQDACIRRTIMKHFVLPGITQGLGILDTPENCKVAGATCCSHCDK